MWSIVAALAAPVCAAVAAPIDPAAAGSAATALDAAQPVSEAVPSSSAALIAGVGLAACVAAVILWKAKLLTGLNGPSRREGVGTPRRNPNEVHPLGWLWALLLMFFVMAIGSVVGGILGGPDTATPRAQALTLGGSALFGLVASVGVFILAKRLAPKAGLVAVPRDLLTGLIAFALAYPIVLAASTAASITASLLGGSSPSPIAHDTLQLIVDQAANPWTWLIIACVVLAIPVVEEVMYRGLLQTTLLRALRGAWTATIASAAIFAAMHWTIIPAGGKHVVVQLFALGLAMGLAFERTGRIGTPIVMHVLFNLTNILLAVAVTASA